MTRLTAIIFAGIIIFLVMMVWAVKYYRVSARAYKGELDKANEQLSLAISTITGMQDRQRDVEYEVCTWSQKNA